MVGASPLPGKPTRKRTETEQGEALKMLQQAYETGWRDCLVFNDLAENHLRAQVKADEQIAERLRKDRVTP